MNEAAYDMRAAVRRGIEKLDAERPGWRDKIDWDALRMNNNQDCVLGQLFGDFGTAIRSGRLDGITTKNAADFGFTFPDRTLHHFDTIESVWRGWSVAYRELADTWRKEGH